MKQNKASKGAECRHPVRQRHAALLSNVRSKGNETGFIRHRNRVQQVRPLVPRRLVPLRSTNSRCRRPRSCRTHSHRGTRKSVWMCAESTATVIIRGGHRAASSFQHGTSANVPRYQKHSCRALRKYLCVWVSVGEAEKIGAQGDTSTQQEAQPDDSDACGTEPTSTITHGGSKHPSSQRKQNERKKIFKTRRQGVAVCVALRVSASPGRKQTKTRGKKCVLRPTGPRRTPTRHGSLSAPFVAALLMRAAGEAHRAVVVSVSVGVQAEQLGGKRHGTPHRKSAATTI
ncbi:hypothetical protein TcCL_Unassigned02175, partial [Trypanosoma cruzi]